MPRGSGAPRSVIILVNIIANPSRDNPYALNEGIDHMRCCVVVCGRSIHGRKILSLI
jgi:hypothetical protein